MESRVHSEPSLPDNTNSVDSISSFYRSSNGQSGDRIDRIAAIRQQMEYVNTIGKRFVAAFDRFQVHRALLATLQDLYHFSACAILLKGEPFELSVIPCYPLNATFLQSIIHRISKIG